MKRIILLAAMLYVALGAMAQDTAATPVPSENYFYNYWIDTSTQYRPFKDYEFGRAGIAAKRYITEDSLQVYGIAAMIVDELFGFQPNYRFPDSLSYLQYFYRNDPTMTHCEESLLLYQYHRQTTVTMQQLGDSMPVHTVRTPVTYWMNLAYPSSALWPVYERYFSSPQTVTDTFYTGITETNSGYVDKEYYAWIHPCVTVVVFRTDPFNEQYDALLVYDQPRWDVEPYWSPLTMFPGGTMFIFPIIAPPDTTANPTDTLVVQPGYTLSFHGGDTILLGGDTIVLDSAVTLAVGDTLVLPSGDTLVFHPGDTIVVNSGDTIFFGPNSTIFFSPGSTIAILGGTGGGDNPGGDDPVVGLRQTDMVYRYTAVSPNPATGRATVTSSFGLTQIEAFDEQGRLVQTLPATGLKATLDISSWPRGTYLLRIHTPLGTATKKLLVQ